MFGFSPAVIIKWTAILTIAGAVIGGGFYLVTLIENNAIAKTQIEALQSTIDGQNVQLELYKTLLEISAEVNENNAKQLDKLNETFQGIEENLGVDQDDAAAESTKELFRRLNRE